MKALPAIALLALVTAGSFAAWHYWPRHHEDPDLFQGYVEGELVYVAAEDGGRIETVVPQAGDEVGAGEIIVTLDSKAEKATRDEAVAKLDQARSTLHNLEAAQQRPEEVAVLEAQKDRAKASLNFTESEYVRQTNLAARGFATTSARDQAKSAFDRDTAALAEIERQIDAAHLAGRSNEIAAAEAAVQAAIASLAMAETKLARRSIAAPAGASVEDVYFRPGEVVIAGQPILALLPSANRKVRFYVPETRLSEFSLGQGIEVSCDGCGAAFPAKLSYLSSKAEYTPPVIFSETERAKLVFRLEARPEAGRALPLGLPVDVRKPAHQAGGPP